MIARNKSQIQKPGLNPTAGLIEETLHHHGITQVAASKAMSIRPSLLNDVIRGRKGVSAELAIRFQKCFGVPADFLSRLQSTHDLQKAHHSKGAQIEAEVQPLIEPAA